MPRYLCHNRGKFGFRFLIWCFICMTEVAVCSDRHACCNAHDVCNFACWV
jgi:hypothetical protein